MKIHYKGRPVNLPDFFIVGAARSGTTSLYYYLRQHPDIFLAAIKEPWFFSYANASPEIVNAELKYHQLIVDPERYFNLFSKTVQGQFCGEASSSYLYKARETIENMKYYYQESLRKVKIIILLRNPIERAWSQYQLHRRDGLEDKDFREACDSEVIRSRLDNKFRQSFDYIGYGMYFQQVSQYLENFPHAVILRFEDFRNSPDETLKIIDDFLGVPYFPPVSQKIRYNSTGEPKSAVRQIISKLIYQQFAGKSIVKHILPARLRYRLRVKLASTLFTAKSVVPKDRKWLVEIYREDIEKLGRLTQLDVNSWLRF